MLIGWMTHESRELLEVDLRKPQGDDPVTGESYFTVNVVGYCINRDWFVEIHKHNCYRFVLANINDTAASSLYKASCHTPQIKVLELTK
ncbi:hypothetical protein BgiBS90_022729 [Biomphalaria glabrata]|nr:hypothetical protein BgiBS90_022729 [Biomphalaria glabrata]